MGKKVCVEIEYSKIIEKDIELPEGKTVDDVMCCTANNKHVRIQFYDTDEQSIHLDFGDFETRCDFNTATCLLDEDTNKRVRFR